MTDASDILLKPITVAMIEALEAEQGRFYELVDGELQEKEMATPLHGKIASRLNIFIGGFVLRAGIGQTYDSSASYVLRGTPEKPELIYLPDFSFVAQERVQDKDRGFFLGAPDLAVEVISPSERPAAIAHKLRNSPYAVSIRNAHNTLLTRGLSPLLEPVNAVANICLQHLLRNVS
jgi:Uma2 family endonuclease